MIIEAFKPSNKLHFEGFISESKFTTEKGFNPTHLMKIRNGLCEIKFSHDVFNLDEQHASKLRKKESEFKRSTSTRKGVHTVMLTTWGISGSHSIGLVSNNLTIACFFQ